MTILQVLGETNRVMTQAEVEKVLRRLRKPLSLRTIGLRLKGLRKRGLVTRPKGDTSGDAITDAGRRAMEKCAEIAR